MKFKKLVSTISAGVFLGVSFITASYADNIDDRQAKQEQRVEQGVESGQLTTKEYNKFEKQQGTVQKMEDRFMKDDKLTPKEHFILNKQLNRTSGSIYKEKHDPQTVDGVAPNFQGSGNKPYFKKPLPINAREGNQQGRIWEGVKSGELTRPEVKRLEAEQIKINRMESKFKSDGDFTLKERARVQHQLNQSSRHIYNAKHNGRSR